MTTSAEPAARIVLNEIVVATVAPIHPFSDDPEASIPEVNADLLADS